MIINCIYNIIIGPIELILEVIYRFLILVVRNNYGFAILGISLIVSLLCLPLFLKAEKLQEKERYIQKKMSKKIKSIKKNFNNDEKYMILSMYYRENHYHPIMALRSSLSLLLQIPFFIAAYHFLSKFEPLRGESFFVIRNLGSPDELFSIGAFKINFLPILMTIINLFSAFIYSRGFSLKEKIQLYVMPVLFLLILYNSPAGLVLYWTCNNIFSLIKTIVLKNKNKSIIFYAIMSAILICSCLYVIFFRRTGSSHYVSFILLSIGFSIFILSMPLLVKLFKKITKESFLYLKDEEENIKKIFAVSCLAFGILCVIFIPFNVTASDPAEFSFIINESPFNVLIAPFLISLGLFCFWPLYIFFLCNPMIKAAGSFIMIFLLYSGVINTFLFSGNYGILTQYLTFADDTDFLISNLFVIINCFSVILIFLIIFLLFYYKKIKILYLVSILLMISISILSLYKAKEIQDGYTSYKSIVNNNKNLLSDNFSNINPINPEISLSKNGINIFILMLDKAASVFFNHIINERKELQNSFDGFVYYPNTVSFFRSTILGAPPLFGGYEYTPELMHQRNKELMKDKHNESYLVLPELFKNKGYYISVFDLPYVNYQSKMDISFFTRKGINANNIEGKYINKFIYELGSNAPIDDTQTDMVLKHNFCVFSLLMTAPVFLREYIYDRGNYWSAIIKSNINIIKNKSIKYYSNLNYLPELTDTENSKNTFTIMVSNLAHDPSFLQYPDYSIVSEITDYGPDLFNGNINSFQYYHVSAASYILLSKWFDYLKENNVYNNTRIIIVADHAEVLVDPDNSLDKEYVQYNPILLFKDFNSTGKLIIDKSFMTNADTPLLAVKDLFIDAINPFTGNSLKADKEEGVNIYLGGSSQPRDYSGNKALQKKAPFYHVKDNIFDTNNWKKITKRY